MLRFFASLQYNKNSKNKKSKAKDKTLKWCARVLERTIPVIVASLLFLVMSYIQPECENELVSFDIPASTLSLAIREFARQAQIDLVFADSGLGSIRTNSVVGSFRKERALEMLLVGTGLSATLGPADSVIVLRTGVNENTEMIGVHPRLW
ncbi:MAG: hypothetical protein AAGF72_02000 [Pseudomonadota bacterium]